MRKLFPPNPDSSVALFWETAFRLDRRPGTCIQATVVEPASVKQKLPGSCSSHFTWQAWRRSKKSSRTQLAYCFHKRLVITVDSKSASASSGHLVCLGLCSLSSRAIPRQQKLAVGLERRALRHEQPRSCGTLDLHQNGWPRKAVQQLATMCTCRAPASRDAVQSSGSTTHCLRSDKTTLDACFEARAPARAAPEVLAKSKAREQHRFQLESLLS